MLTLSPLFILFHLSHLFYLSDLSGLEQYLSASIFFSHLLPLSLLPSPLSSLPSSSIRFPKYSPPFSFLPICLTIHHSLLLYSFTPSSYAIYPILSLSLHLFGLYVYLTNKQVPLLSYHIILDNRAHKLTTCYILLIISYRTLPLPNYSPKPPYPPPKPQEPTDRALHSPPPPPLPVLANG